MANRWGNSGRLYFWRAPKSLRRRKWHPTPVLLPGKPHGQRSLVGCSPWGRYESDMTEWLHFHFSLSCIGEGNGNPLQYSCLENPRDRGAWWAAVYGVAQSRTRLRRLSSSSSSNVLNETTQLSNSPFFDTKCRQCNYNGTAPTCHRISTTVLILNVLFYCSQLMVMVIISLITRLCVLSWCLVWKILSVYT